MIPPLGRLIHVAVLAAIVLALSLGRVAAQPRSTLDLTAGATVLRNRNVFEGNRAGWLLAADWNFTERLGVGFEMGRSGGAQTLGFLTADTHTTTMMAGPRVSWTLGPVRVFALVSGGAARLDVEIVTNAPLTSAGSVASTHRAISVGGGVDLAVLDRISVRTAYDLRRVFVSDPYSEHRLLVGVVYAIH